MGKILLDYTFPIQIIEPTPPANTAFLKQVCIVVKPKAGQEGNVGDLYLCTNMTQVLARTDNENAEQLFAGGLSRLYLLLADDLDVASALVQGQGEFWTVLISDDFDDEDVTNVPGDKATIKIQDITYTAVATGVDGNDITIAYVDTNTGGAATASVTGDAISVSIEGGVTTAATIAAAIVASTPASALVVAAVDAGDGTDPQAAVSATNLAGGSNDGTTATFDKGSFDGVVGYSSSDASVAADFAAIEKQVGFFNGGDNGASNMFYAFGKFLSNPVGWKNQQYITMPFSDGVDELGEAVANFDDRISFVISDSDYGNRLAFFAAGGKAIVAPYIKKNLAVDAQGQALTWISANQPQYTITNATLLESNIQDKVIDRKYIETGLITEGTISITLVEDNFVANGTFLIDDPTALWRVNGVMQSIV